jgi:hypothetical protein
MLTTVAMMAIRNAGKSLVPLKYFAPGQDEESLRVGVKGRSRPGVDCERENNDQNAGADAAGDPEKVVIQRIRRVHLGDKVREDAQEKHDEEIKHQPQMPARGPDGLGENTRGRDPARREGSHPVQLIRQRRGDIERQGPSCPG